VSAVNVNLKPCNCEPMRLGHEKKGRIETVVTHHDGCATSPVLIPCPIPRSVTFEVVLGECRCAGPCSEAFWMNTKHTYNGQHWSNCPARPVRVTCSVSGKTWEESEVSDAERDDRALESLPPRVEDSTLLAASRERWALVKALVTGHGTSLVPFLTRAQAHALQAHRNTVFAALADVARVEDAAARRQECLNKLLRRRPAFVHHGRAVLAASAPSASGLAQYVADLIEQVGSPS
jgi:hypothetical protein